MVNGTGGSPGRRGMGIAFSSVETLAVAAAVTALLSAATAQEHTGSIPRAAARSAGESTAECLPREAVSGIVRAVTDGRTFTLTDGREIRLPAIEIPAPEATDALAALIQGQEVVLSPLAPATDRYGRHNMRAFIAGRATPQPVEAALVVQGFALAAPRTDDPGCMAVLLAAERIARTGRLGIWQDANAERFQAERPADVLAAQGRFALVEGKVVSVRESGGTLYVNFGRRWTEDFTVTILKRNERKFAAAGLEPRRLEGRRVRVRGFIEERGGPWIEATLPQQIEIVEDR